MRGLWSDITLSLRKLSQRRRYAAAAIATLALGIGATVALSAAAYAVLLAPHPVRDIARVAVGWGLAPATSHGLVELTFRDIEALANGSRTLSSVAAIGSTTWTAVLDGAGDAVRIPYAGVSGSFFETLGVQAQLGRTLRPSDDVPGAPSVIVVSHDAWVRRFGSDPNIVGRMLELDGDRSEVVGVAPAGFDVPRGAEFWAPVVPPLAAASSSMKTDVLANVGVFFYLGRLRPEASMDSVADELSERGRQIDGARGSLQIGSRVTAVPLDHHLVGPTRNALWTLMGAVVVWLLTASVTIAGLQLVDATTREREHAIRLALGATSGDLARARWLEAAVLVAAAGCVACAIAPGLLRVLVALAPDDVPRLASAAIDGPAMTMGAATMLVSLLICAIVPRRTGDTPTDVAAMNAGARSTAGARPRRLRSMLVGTQVALTVPLLVTAALVVVSFDRLRSGTLGFESDGVIALRVDPRVDPTTVNPWMSTLIDSLRTNDVVSAVGAVYLRPLALGPIGQGTTVLLEGQPDTEATVTANPLLNYQVATPGYFATMRVPVLAGRTFTDDDRADSERVVVVSASTASRLWPGRPAVGQRLRTASFDRRPGAPRQAWRRVVGVVADVRYRGLTEVSLDLYDPATQSSTGATDLVVRTRVDPRAAISAVRDDVRRLAPNAIVDDIATLDALVARARAPWRFGAWILATFAGAATLLSALGLFSVVALDVTERRAEFAVRQALGATAIAIVVAVARSAVAAAGIGGSLGLGVAAALSIMLRGWLVGVSHLDPWAYGGVALLVALVVVAATAGPARRAARTSPAELLRHG